MKLLRRKKRAGGFGLIELTLAMFVMAVGVLGGMMMIIMGMSRNNTNRVDTTATNIAQTVMEEISAAPPNVNKTLTITDCVQTNPATSTLQINTAPGGATVLNGNINFSADSATTLNASGYQMNYTVCGTNGLRAVYDVRWRVDLVGGANWSKLVTVSARQPFIASQRGISFLAPVTLRTMVGM
ncbi:MAG TPA: hypothetical protein VN669_08450 [Candidatus Acidoferrales bacterium]|nr:hypothetical protein [Candidatus Acidoferrales bacterium]